MGDLKHPMQFRYCFGYDITDHCGRNTNFRQIHFSVPDFNINIYNFNNYVTNERDQMHNFFIILQVTTSIAIVYIVMQSKKNTFFNKKNIKKK